MALDLENIELPINNSLDAFIMYVSESEKEYAISLTQYLRMNNYKVEMEYMGRGLKGQFKQADRLNSKYLIILNDEDLQNDMVKIKNNETKEETEVGIDYIIYFFEEQATKEEYSDIDIELYMNENVEIEEEE